jgi:hypothetical protein
MHVYQITRCHMLEDCNRTSEVFKINTQTVLRRERHLLSLGKYPQTCEQITELILRSYSSRKSVPMDRRHECLKRHLSYVLLRHVFTQTFRRRRLCMEVVSLHVFPFFVTWIQPVNKIDLSDLYAPTEFLSPFLSTKPSEVKVR